MLSKLTVTIGLALVLSFSASIAEAQISNAVGLLQADVHGADGTPLSNIPISIFRGTERISNGKTSSDGTFKTIVQPNSMYRIAYNSTEFGYHEDTLRVPALAKYEIFPVHTVLSAIHEGEYFPLNTPVFSRKSSLVEPSATAQLDDIVNLMNHNPKLRLGVTVYPDAPIKSKKDIAQQKMVDSRASALRSYFLSKGVKLNRLDLVESTAVPAGRFSSTSPDPVPASKAKRKKGKTSVPALIPQYTDIVVHLSN